MKKAILLFALVTTTLASIGQTKPSAKKQTATVNPVISKFGALAIDRSNGFYYGWSFDYSTLAEAEQKAIDECKQKGGNCSVVLSYSGTGCAAYRTIDGKVGTAFGWGLAKTKEEADAIASIECSKRSLGNTPVNFVWSCNSANTGTLKEIYNAKSEILTVVKIGTQIWTSKNLNVKTFSNGDPILLAKNNKEWADAGEAGKPACRYLDDLKENGNSYGLIYNWYAANDSRGLAPAGYSIPTKGDWLTLVNFIGDFSTLSGKLKSKTEWTELNGTDDFGFNGLPAGNAGSTGGFNGKGGAANYWSSTSKDDTYGIGFIAYGHRQKFDNDLSGFDKSSGMYVRCIKK